MNLFQLVVVSAGLSLAVVWWVRSRAPEAKAVKLRNVALDLEGMVRSRRDLND